jgi:electron transport complex protein RnfG
MSNKIKKPESTFVNMVIALMLVATIAGLALGAVYMATEEPIAMTRKAKLEAALNQVLPGFDEVKTSVVAPVDGTDSLIFYTAFRAGEEVGVAIKSYTNKGYSGYFDVMVGFTPDNKIYSTAVLKHAETPGLGDKIDKKKSTWSNQFDRKNPETFKLYVKKDQGDVDAITAATISSRAYCDALRRAWETYKIQQGDE